METITLINISDFFDLDSISTWRPAEVQLYEIRLISKVTGELITITLDDEYFDILIAQMQRNIKNKCDLYHKLCMKGETYDGTSWR